MTPMTKEALAELRLKAVKATKGEWWSDSIGNEGTYGVGDDCVEGFTSYAVYDENDRVLLDTLNSSAACIQEEYDGECHVAWDEVGLRNAEFIAAANPATVLALLDALDLQIRTNQEMLVSLDAKDTRIAEQAEIIARQEKWIKGIEEAMIAAADRAKSAEQALLLERQKETRSIALPRPTCTYADHSYPAYSERQVVALLESLGITLQLQGGE